MKIDDKISSFLQDSSKTNIKQILMRDLKKCSLELEFGNYFKDTIVYIKEKCKKLEKNNNQEQLINILFKCLKENINKKSMNINWQTFLSSEAVKETVETNEDITSLKSIYDQECHNLEPSLFESAVAAPPDNEEVKRKKEKIEAYELFAQDVKKRASIIFNHYLKDPIDDDFTNLIFEIYAHKTLEENEKFKLISDIFTEISHNIRSLKEQISKDLKTIDDFPEFVDLNWQILITNISLRLPANFAQNILLSARFSIYNLMPQTPPTRESWAKVIGSLLHLNIESNFKNQYLFDLLKEIENSYPFSDDPNPLSTRNYILDIAFELMKVYESDSLKPRHDLWTFYKVAEPILFDSTPKTPRDQDFSFPCKTLSYHPDTYFDSFKKDASAILSNISNKSAPNQLPNLCQKLARDINTLTYRSFPAIIVYLTNDSLDLLTKIFKSLESYQYKGQFDGIKVDDQEIGSAPIANGRSGQVSFIYYIRKVINFIISNEYEKRIPLRKAKLNALMHYQNQYMIKASSFLDYLNKERSHLGKDFTDLYDNFLIHKHKPVQTYIDEYKSFANYCADSPLEHLRMLYHNLMIEEKNMTTTSTMAAHKQLRQYEMHMLKFDVALELLDCFIFNDVESILSSHPIFCSFNTGSKILREQIARVVHSRFSDPTKPIQYNVGHLEADSRGRSIFLKQIPLFHPFTSTHRVFEGLPFPKGPIVFRQKKANNDKEFNVVGEEAKTKRIWLPDILSASAESMPPRADDKRDSDFIPYEYSSPSSFDFTSPHRLQTMNRNYKLERYQKCHNFVSQSISNYPLLRAFYLEEFIQTNPILKSVEQSTILNILSSLTISILSDKQKLKLEYFQNPANHKEVEGLLLKSGLSESKLLNELLFTLYNPKAQAALDFQIKKNEDNIIKYAANYVSSFSQKNILHFFATLEYASNDFLRGFFRKFFEILPFSDSAFAFDNYGRTPLDYIVNSKNTRLLMDFLRIEIMLSADQYYHNSYQQTSLFESAILNECPAEFLYELQKKGFKLTETCFKILSKNEEYYLRILNEISMPLEEDLERKTEQQVLQEKIYREIFRDELIEGFNSKVSQIEAELIGKKEEISAAK